MMDLSNVSLEATQAELDYRHTGAARPLRPQTRRIARLTRRRRSRAAYSRTA